MKNLFVPSFNTWYLVAPLLCVFMAFVGNGRYHGYQHAYERKGGRAIDVFMALLCTVTLVTMVIFESGLGLVQIFINSLRGIDSKAWAYIATFFVVTVLAALYLMLLLTIADKFAEAKRRRIRRRRAPNPYDNYEPWD